MTVWLRHSRSPTADTTLGMSSDAGHRKPAEVYVLGRPRLVIDGTPVVRGIPEKAFLMFAALALAGGQMDRDQLRALLWASTEMTKRAGNLRQLLARVHSSTGNSVIVESADRYVRLSDLEQNIDVRRLMSDEPLDPSDWYLLDLDLLQGITGLGYEGEEFLRNARQSVNDHRVRHIEAILIKDDLSAGLKHGLSSCLVALDPSREAGWRGLFQAALTRNDIHAAKRALSDGMKHCRVPAFLARASHGEPMRFNGGEWSPGPEPEAPTPHIPKVILLPPQVDEDDELLIRLSRFLLEEITLGLSRQKLFKVIAAHTTFELMSSKSLASDVAKLGVDYAVSVTVVRCGQDLRTTYRLTRIDTSEVIWSGDIPLVPEHLTSSFDSIGDKISMALAGSIERHELASPVQEANSTAFRLYLEGKKNLVATDLRLLRGARRWFRASLRHFDDFALAHVGLARTLSLEYLLRSQADGDVLELARLSAAKGLAIDPGASRAYRELGHISLYKRQHDLSIEYFSEARNLAPNDADMLADYADTLCHDGRIDEALVLIKKAYRLNPLPSDYYHWYLGGIHFMREEYELALEALATVREKPTVARLLTAIHAERGDIHSARRYAKLLMEQHPGFRTEQLYSFIPDRRRHDTTRLVKGLNAAGLL